MAKVLKTQRPEDFALQLLDDLMEAKGDTLTPFQLAAIAQAYAAAGQAINTLEAGGSVVVNQNLSDSEDDLYEGFEAVYEYKNAADAPPGYVLTWSGAGRFWVNPHMTYEKIIEKIDQLRGRPTKQTINDPEAAKFANDEAERIFQQAAPAYVQREHKRSLGGETVVVPRTVEPVGSKTPPTVRGEDLDAVARDWLNDDNHKISTVPATSPWLGPVGSEVLHEEILERPMTASERFAAGGERAAAEADARMARAVEESNVIDSKFGGGIYGAKSPVTGKYVFFDDVYEKEPTKILPANLKERIEAAIAEKAKLDEEEVSK